MKASEVIKALEAIIATEGDLEVEVPYYEWTEFHPLASAAVSKKPIRTIQLRSED
jgi:hypothetical protein